MMLIPLPTSSTANLNLAQTLQSLLMTSRLQDIVEADTGSSERIMVGLAIADEDGGSSFGRELCASMSTLDIG